MQDSMQNSVRQELPVPGGPSRRGEFCVWFCLGTGPEC